MNERAPDNEGKPVKRDRWGKVPVQPGFLRGFARNIRYSEGISPYGQTIVVEFELWSFDGSPEVPVRMEGTDFQGRITETALMDVADPDPSIRPITTERLLEVDDHRDLVIAQYPGRKFLPLPSDQRWQALFIVVPAVSLLLLSAVILYIVGVPG
jgi:hypothetical protein